MTIDGPKIKMLDELKDIIGEDEYTAFLNLLKEIGPDSRTHRISVVIAGLLRFARSRVPEDFEDSNLATALVVLDEEPYTEGEDYETLKELIGLLCRKAGMRNERVSSRGDSYTIAEHVLYEYTKWYNMPWED